MRTLAILFLLLCFPSAQTRADFRFRIADDYGSLDWGYGEVTSVVVQQLMEGLTLSGKTGEALPGLAESWRSFDVGSRAGFVFNIRKNARWSDGKAVCAQDFVDAWLRVLSPRFASPYAHYLFDIANAIPFHSGVLTNSSKVGVRAEGCARLVVQLERPASYFPALTSHWVLFPIRLDLIERFKNKWTDPANLVVTGPYTLKEWAHDERFVLIRNHGYYGKQPHEEVLRGQVIPDDGVAISLFQKQRLDWVKDLPFLEKAKLSQLPEYRAFPAFVEYHLGFNFSAGALTHDERCALSLSLDKEQIPSLLKGGEVPAWGLVPSSMGSSAKSNFSRFDPALARKLIAKTKRREFDLYFYSKDIHVPIVEWAQEQWRANLGVKVRLHKMESKTYWNFLSKTPPEIFLSGITAAFAHPYSFLSEFLSKSAANWGHFAAMEYDNDAASVGRGLPRIESAQRTLLSESCAIIPLYFRSSASLISGQWEGLHVNPLTYVYLSAVRHR